MGAERLPDTVADWCSASVDGSARALLFGHTAPVTEPILRALMESGATWDDPSEDLIFELLNDIVRGDEQFVVIERTRDATGQTYAQAIQSASGGFILERRDGDADHHYRAACRDVRDAHRALAAWAHEIGDWQAVADWQLVSV